MFSVFSFWNNLAPWHILFTIGVYVILNVYRIRTVGYKYSIHIYIYYIYISYIYLHILHNMFLVPSKISLPFFRIFKNPCAKNLGLEGERCRKKDRWSLCARPPGNHRISAFYITTCESSSRSSKPLLQRVGAAGAGGGGGRHQSCSKSIGESLG